MSKNNLLKVISAPFKLVLLGISYVIPKNKHLWVFGSRFGFSNNAKYLFLQCNENKYENIKTIWVGTPTEVNEIKKYDLPCVTRWSIKGLWICLRSGVYIFDSYVTDINGYTVGCAKKINLWHGVGIKNIERKISSGPCKDLFQTKNIIRKFNYLGAFYKPNILLSTSPLMTQHFSECFGINKNEIIESIYPRNEVFKMDKQELLKYINRYEDPMCLSLFNEIEKYKKTFLYMPTWRDSGIDFLSTEEFNFNIINEIMQQTESLFLLKPHPSTKLPINSEYSNIRIVDGKTNIYPLMSCIDYFITDYSSVYYDWLLLKNKQLILYIPDYEYYISHERDLAFPYDENVSGIKIYSFNDFINYLRDPYESRTNKENELKERFWHPHILNIKALQLEIFKQVNEKR